MKRFGEIVNNHKDNIYGGGRIQVELSDTGEKIFLFRDISNKYTKVISLNDLLSPESGFLQACKWKRDNGYDDDGLMWKYGNNGEPLYRTYMREHHAMMLSILSQEEKIKYIKENVIVE